MNRCPNCDAELSQVSDAYCPECRQELPASAEPVGTRPALSAAEAGWLFYGVAQGVIALTLFGSLLIWMVLSFVERLQAK